MKRAFILLAVLVIVAMAAPAGAQDWVMDWNSTGFAEVTHWNISGTSPTTLTPVPGSLPPTFTGQAYDLRFTWEGRTYGGRVATGPLFNDFSTGSHWAVPEPCSLSSTCTFNTNFASGTFNFTDANHFTLDVGLGQSTVANAHFTGTGQRATASAAAPEPATLAFGALGLLAAAFIRRTRR